MKLDVTRIVGVHVAEGALQILERHLDRAPRIRNLFGSEDDQAAVTRPALGVARQLDLHDFGVGSLDRFIRSHDLGAGASAAAEDANRPEPLVKSQLLMEHRLQVGDHNAQGVAGASSHELSQPGVDHRRRCRRSRSWCGRRACTCRRTCGDLAHHLLYDTFDEIVSHYFPPSFCRHPAIVET